MDLVFRKSFNFKRIVTFTALSILLIISLFISSAILIGYKVTNPMIKDIDKSPTDYGLEYEEIKIYNVMDNLTLSGWWIPTKNTPILQNEKAIIFAHGYGYNRTQMPFDSLELAKRLSNEGYHVLMFDFRNSGLSERSPTTIGYKEKTDLLSAINYTSYEKGVKNIALMGWSMGASTSILAGIESEEVKAVIADSAFADLGAYTKESFSYWTGLPEFMAVGFTKIAEYLFPEFKISEVKPIAVADDYPPGKGLFLIHSKKDGAIPYSQSQLLHESSQNSELWMPPKGGHIRSYKHFKEEYEEKVLLFLDNYFLRENIVDRPFYLIS